MTVDEKIQAIGDLEDRTVITVEDFARLLGISRSAAYEAASRDEFPIRRLGRRLFVPVPALRRWLGVEEDKPRNDGSSLNAAVTKQEEAG